MGIRLPKAFISIVEKDDYWQVVGLTCLGKKTTISLSESVLTCLTHWIQNGRLISRNQQQLLLFNVVNNSVPMHLMSETRVWKCIGTEVKY